MKKPQIILIAFLAILVFINSSFAQKQKKPCFEVKHFDFFSLKDDEKVNWSNEELDKLSEVQKYEGKTNFLVPFLVFQLKDFHSNCTKTIDKERYDRLLSLYFKIRQKDISQLKNKSIDEQLLFIREDFYSQLNDEKLLPFMRYTMDDGPLYGEIPKSIPKSTLLETIITDFGKLAITKSNNQIFLIATDKNNKLIWSRIMKGTNSDRFLRDIKFDKEPIEKTSLATIIHFYSEGERLNLYLKPNGDFMYYFHSW